MTDNTQLNMALEEAEFLRQRMLDSLEFSRAASTEDSYLEFLHTLYALVDKEHSVITRLTFMDDPTLEEVATQLAGPHLCFDLEYKSPNEFYLVLKSEIKAMIKDFSGEDLDEPVDLS